MPSAEDKILVQSIKQGSSKAFEQLFLRYQKKLVHFCRRFVTRKEESENLVQNVFMEIWENRLSLDAEKSFSGFLFTITRNKIYNHIRKTINEKIYKEYIAGNPEAEDPRVYESKESEEMLAKLIGSMPDRRKEIFLMSRNMGLTYKEIAQRLGISENTVDTQIRNALDFLREELKKLR
jgi:RNA polymerase sigma-70 factor (ECF subfamily)